MAHQQSARILLTDTIQKSFLYNPIKSWLSPKQIYFFKIPSAILRIRTMRVAVQPWLGAVGPCNHFVALQCAGIFALWLSHLCHFQGFVVAQGQQSDPKVPRIPIPVVGFHEVQIQKSLSCQFILLHLKIFCFKGIKTVLQNLFSLQTPLSLQS